MTASKQEPKKTRFDDLVYATGRWEIYRQDAGMGEKDYCVLRNGDFFCRTEHEQLAKDICTAYDKSRTHSSQPVPEPESECNFPICGSKECIKICKPYVDRHRKAERERVLKVAIGKIREQEAYCNDKSDGGENFITASGWSARALQCAEVIGILESLRGGERE